MSDPSREELMARLAAAQAEEEACVASLVYLELGELLPGLDASEDQAAAALRDATGALAAPLAQLAAIDDEIARAEGRCNEWSGQLSEGNPDSRAVARMHFNEWTGELAALRARRDQAEALMQPYRDEQARRRKALADIQTVKRAVMFAQLHPFTSDLAQATETYTSLRMPMLGTVLLRRDVDSGEWDRALDQLREWCMRSGYRTDDLPSEAEQVARGLAAPMADAAAAPPAPAPNAAEVMALDKARFENMRLQQQRTESVRVDVPSAVPRNDRVPGYMRVDTGLRRGG